LERFTAVENRHQYVIHSGPVDIAGQNEWLILFWEERCQPFFLSPDKKSADVPKGKDISALQVTPSWFLAAQGGEREAR
jgi:hypothetical protein